MPNRRDFIGITAASLLPISMEAQAPRPNVELARHALTGPLEAFELVLLELNSRPSQIGTASAGHRHPGPVLGYVIEGQMRFAINNGPAQVIPAGGTFFEPFGAVHTTSGSASSDAPARGVVFMIVPKGSALTAPA